MKKKTVTLLLAGLLSLGCFAACNEETTASSSSSGSSEAVGERVDGTTWTAAFADLDFENCKIEQTIVMEVKNGDTTTTEINYIINDKKAKCSTGVVGTTSNESYFTEVEGKMYVYRNGAWSTDSTYASWGFFISSLKTQYGAGLTSIDKMYGNYTYDSATGEYIYSMEYETTSQVVKIVIKERELYSFAFETKIEMMNPVTGEETKTTTKQTIVFEKTDLTIPEFQKPAEDSASSNGQ